MKTMFSPFRLAFLVAFISTAASAQSLPAGPIMIQQNTDASALAAALTSGLSSSLIIRQATLQGHTSEGAASSGLYTLGSEGATNGYGLNHPGVVLSTGNVSDYGSGPNQSGSRTTGYGVPATSDQETLLDPITTSGGVNFNHFDVTQLDIDFDVTADENFVTFNVVFGSEEYAEYVNSQYIDGFGIYLNGQNIALASGKPVNINHPEMAPIDGTELDGVLSPQGSVIMQFTALVEPGSVNNKLTFILADTSDDALDTTVYIFSLGASVPPPPLTISNGSVVEGNDGTRNMVFQVELSDMQVGLQALTETVRVSYNTEDITAKAGVDYTATSGLLTFPPGTTSRQILVPVLGDTVAEGNETFRVRLTNPVGASFAGPPAIGTIIDDDSDDVMTVFASVSDVTVVEGNSGTTNCVFTIMLSCPSSQVVSVNYRTVNGSAVQGSDFVGVSGVLEFQPGELQRTVTVQVLGDQLNEADEKFSLVLSKPTNAVLGDDRGVGTILNDDPVTAQISIYDTSVQEGNAGTATASFTVCLSEPSGQAVGVRYKTVDGTATAGNDYQAAAGFVVIPAGQTSKTVNIVVKSDALVEPAENFFVQLSSPIYATIADGEATGTILDNPLPVISIANATVTEGNEGTTVASFKVTLAAASQQPVFVGYSTADGTAKAADNDYIPASGQLYFAPGETEKNIEVLVQGDLNNEADETFYVNLNNQIKPLFLDTVVMDPTSGVLLNKRATGTILNDDQVTARLCIDNVVVLEPGSGTTNAIFNVTMSEPSGQTVYVKYVTANGTALAGSDYATKSGYISFPPGVTSRTIVVAVYGETLPEDAETFFVNLYGAVNATIDQGVGTCTILNATDANAPTTLSIANASVTEGNEGTTGMVFTVSMPFPSSKVVTVNYVTANSTAKAGEDYISASGTLTFPPGTTSQTITVQVLGDLVYELNEVFLVNLSSPVNATLVKKQATGTIVNDEPLPKISIQDSSTVEGDSGFRYLEFELTLSGVSSRNITVNFATADGSATAPDSYQARNGTLVFPSGTSTQCVAVVIYGNTTIEADKTLRMLLSKAVNAAIDDGEGVGTIVNDDGLPGHLDHFEWSPIASPQTVNQLIPVIISAKDRFGGPVPDYTGIVDLTATAVSLDGGGHNILGNQVHQLSTKASVTAGYAFTPNQNIVVTHVRHYGGTKVSIWKSNGQLLVAQAVSGTAGSWHESQLDTPVLLEAGNTYRIGVLTTAYYYRFGTGSTFDHGTIGGNFQAQGDNFPTQSLVVRPFVDITYAIFGGSSPVTVLPTQSGVFQNGEWSGQVVLPATADLVSLTANDGFGHVGTSASFTVQAGANLASLTYSLVPVPQGNLQLQSAGNLPVNNHMMRLFFTPRRAYTVEASEDLVNWTPVFTNVTGSAGSYFTGPVGGGKLFYRAVLNH